MRRLAMILVMAAVIVAAPQVSAGQIKSQHTRLTLSVSHGAPTTGARVHFRAVFKNISERTLWVPRYLLEHLSLSGDYTEPGAKSVETDDAPVIPAPIAKVEWRKLRPGASMEVLGDFSDVFTSCKSGCQSGVYRLKATLAHPMVKTLRRGQTVPDRLVKHVKVEVTPHRLPRTGRDLSFKLLGGTLGASGEVHIRTEVKNRSKLPIWIPTPDRMLVECSYRMLTRDGTVLSRHPVRARGFRPYDERHAVLLGPGERRQFKMSCGGSKLKRVRQARVYVRADIRPVAEFYPLAATPSPYYLAGPLRSNQVRAR